MPGQSTAEERWREGGGWAGIGTRPTGIGPYRPPTGFPGYTPGAGARGLPAGWGQRWAGREDWALGKEKAIEQLTRELFGRSMLGMYPIMQGFEQQLAAGQGFTPQQRASLTGQMESGVRSGFAPMRHAMGGQAAARGLSGGGAQGAWNRGMLGQMGGALSEGHRGIELADYQRQQQILQNLMGWYGGLSGNPFIAPAPMTPGGGGGSGAADFAQAAAAIAATFI